MTHPTGSTWFALENAALKARLSELSRLCLCAADALDRTLGADERFEPSMETLITQLRKAAE